MIDPGALSGWQRLDPGSAAGLCATRVQLHWAAQPIAAMARALLDPAPDDSHTSLEWQPAAGRLAREGDPWHARAEVVAQGRYYAIKRTVTRDGERVVIEDTLASVGPSAVGVVIEHTVVGKGHLDGKDGGKDRVRDSREIRGERGL